MPQDLVGLFSINALYSACDQLSREQPCFFVVVVVVFFFYRSDYKNVSAFLISYFSDSSAHK